MTRLAALLTGLVMALAGAGFYAPASAIPTDPAVFLVPHQDDEVLSYGASVKEHLLAGRDVHLVLLTDGSSSGECKRSRSGTYGHPNFDATDGVVGTYTAVDREACATFRDQEFLNAASAMQNNVGNAVGTLTAVIRTDRTQDGSLSTAYVEAVVTEYVTLYPEASFKGMTYKESDHAEGHADHDVVGEALNNKYSDGTITDVRYYVKPALWDNISVGSFTRESINVTLDAYRSFGQHSVVGEFCEQYGLSKSQRQTLDNGRTCPQYASNTWKISGGADSKVHQPGQ